MTHQTPASMINHKEKNLQTKRYSPTLAMFKRKRPTLKLTVFKACGVLLVLGGCSSQPPAQEFAPCPATLNCVSSLAKDEEHIIGSFRVGNTNEWECLRKTALQMPGKPKMETKRDDYVRVRFSGFLTRTDDLELQRHGNTAEVRSSARSGVTDFEENRLRVLDLQQKFHQQCQPATE